MNRSGNKLSRIRPLVISIVLIIIAVFLWWTLTVVAAILAIIAVSVMAYSCCAIPLSGIEEDQRDRIVRSRREKLSRRVRREKKVEEKKGISFGDIPIEKVETAPVDRDPSSSTGLQHEIPVTIIEGIGKKYAAKLSTLGIEHLEDLVGANVVEISTLCAIPQEEVKSWIYDAKGIREGAGITSIIELAMSNPEEVFVKIDQAIKMGKLRIPPKHRFTPYKARIWIDAANREMSRLGPDDLWK